MKIKTLFRNSGVFHTKSNGSANVEANLEANGGEANVNEEKNAEQISENSSGIGLETCSLSELIETEHEHSELNGTDSGGTMANSSPEQSGFTNKFGSSEQIEQVDSEHFGSPNVLELDRDFDQLSWSEFKIDFVSFRFSG